MSKTGWLLPPIWSHFNANLGSSRCLCLTYCQITILNLFPTDLLVDVANEEMFDIAADLHSLGPAPEPQRPIRRARFFQSRYNARLPAYHAAVTGGSRFPDVCCSSSCSLVLDLL